MGKKKTRNAFLFLPFVFSFLRSFLGLTVNHDMLWKVLIACCLTLPTEEKWVFKGFSCSKLKLADETWSVWWGRIFSIWCFSAFSSSCWNSTYPSNWAEHQSYRKTFFSAPFFYLHLMTYLVDSQTSNVEILSLYR